MVRTTSWTSRGSGGECWQQVGLAGYIRCEVLHSGFRSNKKRQRLFRPASSLGLGHILAEEFRLPSPLIRARLATLCRVVLSEALSKTIGRLP